MNDLVKRLRTYDEFEADDALLDEAADRIEELEEELGCTKTERHADAEYIGHLMTQLRDARREALEEAARVAHIEDEHANTSEYCRGYLQGRADAAAAIRKLMEGKDE